MAILIDREKLDAEIIVPQSDEKQCLEQLSESYLQVSEMSWADRFFLNSLILRNSPKKLVEIGVSAGSSSVILLNAIKNVEGAFLFSIDLSTEWYQDKEKNSGFIVDDYQHLKTKWKLFTGGLAYNFIEEIGDGIDFCLIDTAHINPGEILDFLTVFPFLGENAVVVFHDTNLHTVVYPYSFLQKNHPLYKWPMERVAYQITNNLLISSIYGKKCIDNNFIRGGVEYPYAFT